MDPWMPPLFDNGIIWMKKYSFWINWLKRESGVKVIIFDEYFSSCDEICDRFKVPSDAVHNRRK